MSDYPIITSRMKTANNDYASDNLKLFFPCNEGVGDTISDIISGVVITDTASIEYTVPHTSTVQVLRDAAVTGSFPAIPLGSSCIFFTVQQCVTLSAFAEISIGLNNEAGYSITPSTSHVEDDNGNKVSNLDALTVSDGQDFIKALAYDGVSKTIDVYDAVTTATVAKTATTTDASAIDSAITPASFVACNPGVAQHLYAFGLYVYGGALPAQAVIISELDTMYKNILNGNKWAAPGL